MRLILKAGVKLLLRADKYFERGTRLKIILPLLTLLTQEMELQRIKMEGKQPTVEDVTRIGQQMHEIQINPISYAFVYIAVQLGYLMAVAPLNVTKITNDLAALLKARRDATTLQ